MLKSMCAADPMAARGESEGQALIPNQQAGGGSEFSTISIISTLSIEYIIEVNILFLDDT